ncbi:holin-like protein [Colwellia chukchiensis]|uniref:Holin-like protein n=1 Tax=Colwellia chukchiensis TaxID=641665 RepID=A0A1H7HN26_9GAMM|nr:CidA/LrgA family protein [Colwellia chukchiensis]SEK51037.1 holin-like protein [Colwellia chukchiensis]
MAMRVTMFKNHMAQVLYSVFAIMTCLGLGKLCALLAPILPASLYGLIIFTLTLHFRLFNADQIKASVVWSIKHMAVCFVPAGVGIINHFELLKQFGLTIIAITFATTFLLLTLVALCYQQCSQEKN